jgi:hypothetical protein
MEISLWVHYMAFVRQQFRPQSSVFLPRTSQYINLKNELGSFWESLHQSGTPNDIGNDSTPFDSVLRDIGEEVYRRSVKLQQGERPSSAFAREVSQLNGGLTFSLSLDKLQTEN